MTTTTNPVVTTEAAQATIEAGGYQCPRCFAQIVKRQATEHVENAQYEEIVCPACDLRWTNVWELTRLLVFGQGDDPDTFTLPAEPEQIATPASEKCEQQLAMIREYIRCELAGDEEVMRNHIREELRYDSVLTHDGETEADPAELEAAVSDKLYDISGMEIDTEAGVGFSYGHLFAMSELEHFLKVIEINPDEASRILSVKQNVHPVT